MSLLSHPRTQIFISALLCYPACSKSIWQLAHEKQQTQVVESCFVGEERSLRSLRAAPAVGDSVVVLKQHCIDSTPKTPSLQTCISACIANHSSFVFPGVGTSSTQHCGQPRSSQSWGLHFPNPRLNPLAPCSLQDKDENPPFSGNGLDTGCSMLPCQYPKFF